MYEYDYANRLAAFDHKISVVDIKTRKNGDNGQVNAFVVNLKHPIPVLKEDGIYRDASTIIVETRYVDMLGPNLKGAIYRFFREYSSVGVAVSSANDGQHARVEFISGFFPSGHRDEFIPFNSPRKLYKVHPLSLTGDEIIEAYVAFNCGNIILVRNAVPQTFSDEELLRVACLVTQ